MVSAIVAKLTSGDGIRLIEQDSCSIDRESAQKATPASQRLLNYILSMGLVRGKSGQFEAL